MKFINFPAPGKLTVTVNTDQVCQIFHDRSLTDAPALLDFGSGEPQGVTDSVADAVRDHYAPKGPADPVPTAVRRA